MISGSEEAVSSRAVKLLASLSKNGGRLGRLVHSLEGIHSESLRWEAELNPKRWTWGFVKDNSGELEIVEWYLGILKACPRLRSVEIVGSSKPLMNDSFDALCPSIPTLKSVKFWSTDIDSNLEPRMNQLQIYELMRKHQFTPLEELNLDYIGWDQIKLFPSKLSLPCRILMLRVNSTLRLYVAENVKLLSLAPLSISSIDISGPLDSSGSDIRELVDSQGPILERLKLNSTGESWTIPSLADYSRTHPGPSIPISPFRILPRLTHLTLRRFHGPSLLLLETLVKHSPSLVSLSFAHSCWVSDMTRSLTAPEEVFPANEILEAILKFSHLRFINLGVLPTEDSTRYASLRSKIEGKVLQSILRFVKLGQRRESCGTLGRRTEVTK